MSVNVLSLRNYGVSFGKRKILEGINLDIGVNGVTHLIGPCGAGKSTLLRSLSGLNNKSSLHRTEGEVYYKGELLGVLGYPFLLEQKPSLLLQSIVMTIMSFLPERATLSSQQQRDLVARILIENGLAYLATQMDTQLTQLTLAERRMVLIIGLVMAAPAVIFLDEPTADLDEESAIKILDMIRGVALNRALILVQHNQELAQYLGGQAILLAGGKIQEESEVELLLNHPQSEAAKEFSGTGTCAAPSLDTDPTMLDESYRDKYKPVVQQKEVPVIIPFGPAGFSWIVRNSLAATPRPGLGGDLEYDLKALSKVHISRLISLEESLPLSAAQALEYGISIYHLPIVDMSVPGNKEADTLLTLMHEWITNKEPVAVHCKAGLGRTGTLIAAYYIFLGMSSEESLQKIRCINPRMVQSKEQEVFLSQFVEYKKELLTA